MFNDRSIEYRSTADWRPFHTHFKVRVMLIIEDPAVTMQCRTSITLFLYSKYCRSITLDSLLCSFTSISFLTHIKEEYEILFWKLFFYVRLLWTRRCCGGLDRMVVGFTTMQSVSITTKLWAWILVMARCIQYNIMW